MKKLSLVVSAYNEEAGIESFHEAATVCCRELLSLGWDYEILYINDGSEDGTLELIRGMAERDSEHVRLIGLSRNFGHEAAMTAGLDYACGDALVFMDADLQHPPKCLKEIAVRLNEGYEVISMVRTENRSAGRIKNLCSEAFYWLINRLSALHFEPNASDFFVISSRVQTVLMHSYRERVRFLRGYVQNIGFKSCTIPYAAAERVAGKSHYSFRKLLAFSFNTIMSFSDMPLKLGIFAGIFSGMLGLAVLIYTIMTRDGAPSGYATIVVLNCFMFSILFLVVGIIGEYISVLFSEIKDRPIYIIEERVNIEEKSESYTGD